MYSEAANRKKEKGKLTRQKLLDAATHLFQQHGFDAVSVDAIVEAAGVSKGTFYIYFESKDTLILDFLTGYVASVDADYRAHLDLLSAEASASETLLALAEKIVDVLTGTIGYQSMRIVYKSMLGENVDMDTVKGYNRALYQLFADILARGIEHGEFRTELSPDTLARHFVMAVRGLSYEWCIRYPDFDLKEQALVHVEILLRGIQTTD